jgi:phage baseplate assembly protein W
MSTSRIDIAFPFHVDGGGLTASVDPGRHVRDLIEQVLFTAPGERVNRPTFGVGLTRDLFAPISAELLEALRFQIQAELTRWLSAIIAVRSVDVMPEDSTVWIRVSYTVLATMETVEDRFTA